MFIFGFIRYTVIIVKNNLTELKKQILIIFVSIVDAKLREIVKKSCIICVQWLFMVTNKSQFAVQGHENIRRLVSAACF